MKILQPSVKLADPHICSDDKNRLNILTAIFDALVRHDEVGYFGPALAQNWQVAADAKTWTFNLREDIIFHNGAAMNAVDVVASIQRACDAAVGGEFGTEGVWASYIGDAKMSTLDEYTFRIVTSQPMADLLDLLVSIPIVPQSVLEEMPKVFVGSGPYKIVSHNIEQVVLEAFTGAVTRQPTQAELIWQAEPNVEKRLSALDLGEADMITNIHIEAADALGLEGHDVLSHESNLCVAFLFNFSQGPGSSKTLRQAVNYAINVPRMIEATHQGAATPLSGPLSPLHFGGDPNIAPYPYDPNKARALLAEIDVGTKVVLDCPLTLPDESPMLAEMFREDLAAVGLEVSVRHYEDRTAYAHMVKDKSIHDICVFDSSPLSTYRVLREKMNSEVAGPWWQGYHNAEVNELLSEASRTIENAARQAIYYKAVKLIHEDVPWLFLYRPTIFFGLAAGTSDVGVGLDGVLQL